MTKATYSCLGLACIITVPATVEEFDSLPNVKPGACLDEAIGNVVYRGVLAGVRSDFVEKLEAHPDVAALTSTEAAKNGKRQTKLTGKNKKVEVQKPDPADATKTITVTEEQPESVYAESEAEYVKRIRALLNLADEAAFAAKFQSTMDEAVALEGNKFDPSETERKAKGPKVLPADYKAAAERVFSKGAQDRAALKIKDDCGVVVTFLEEVGTPEEVTALRTKNVELLGWAIKTHVEWQKKQSLAAL